MLILIHSKYSYIGLFFVICIIWKNKFNQLHFCLSYLLNKSFCSNGDLNNGDLIGWTKSANIGVGEWGGSEYIKLEEIEAVVMHCKCSGSVNLFQANVPFNSFRKYKEIPVFPIFSGSAKGKRRMV